MFLVTDLGDGIYRYGVKRAISLKRQFVGDSILLYYKAV